MLLQLTLCLGESCRASRSLQPVSASMCNHQANWPGKRGAAPGT